MKMRVDRQKSVDGFWSKVSTHGPRHPELGQCWLWMGCKDPDGYGVYGHGATKAHRWSYALHYGDPGPKCVLHKCDVPSCVNPKHLFVGSNQENTTDRHNKDRDAWGERNGMSILRKDQVEEILRTYHRGRGGVENPVGLRALGQKYGVSRDCIYRIVKRINWNRVGI